MNTHCRQVSSPKFRSGKQVKKKKGALKEQAQAKLDELIVQQEAELKKFDAEHGP